jgi:cytochrome b561
MIKMLYTSDAGVGAVLLQGGKDDIYLPNLFKSVTKIRKNNPQLKKKHVDVHFIHPWCLLVTIPSHLLTMCKIQITDQRNED